MAALLVVVVVLVVVVIELGAANVAGSSQGVASLFLWRFFAFWLEFWRAKKQRRGRSKKASEFGLFCLRNKTNRNKSLGVDCCRRRRCRCCRQRRRRRQANKEPAGQTSRTKSLQVSRSLAAIQFGVEFVLAAAAAL